MSKSTILSSAQDLLKRMPLPPVSRINSRAVQALIQAHIVKVATATFLVACIILSYYLYQQNTTKPDAAGPIDPPEPETPTTGTISLLQNGSFNPEAVQAILAHASSQGLPSTLALSRGETTIQINLPEIAQALRDGQREEVYRGLTAVFGPNFSPSELTLSMPYMDEERPSLGALTQADDEGDRSEQGTSTEGSQSLEQRMSRMLEDETPSIALSQYAAEAVREQFMPEDLSTTTSEDEGNRSALGATTEGSQSLEQRVSRILEDETPGLPQHDAEAARSEEIRRQIAEAMSYELMPEDPSTTSSEMEDEFTLIEEEHVPSVSDREIRAITAQRKPRRTGLIGEGLNMLERAGVAACQAANHAVWGEIFNKKDILSAVDSLGLDEWDVPTFLGNIKTINTVTYLGSGAISVWSQELMRRYKRLVVSANSTQSFLGVTYPDLEEGKELYAIPVVVKGRALGADHIVTFLYHAPSHTVIFYDSKGLSIQEYEGYNLAKDNETTSLEEVFNTVMEKYTRSVEGKPQQPNFWYNDERHQYDVYNCGVYVMDWIHRLAVLLMSQDNSFAKAKMILDHEKTCPISSRDAAYTVRKEILERLMPALEKPSTPIETSYAGELVEGAARGVHWAAEATGLAGKNQGLEDLLQQAEEALYEGCYGSPELSEDE